VRLFFNYGCSNRRGEAKVSRRHDDEGLLLLKTLLLLGRLLLLVLAMLRASWGLLALVACLVCSLGEALATQVLLYI